MLEPDFHFLRPLWLLAVPPLALLIWLWVRRDSRTNAWQGVVDAHLLPYLWEAGASRPKRALYAFLTSGVLIACFGLAGPAWQRLPQPVFEQVSYRVVVLDISDAMNRSDVAPSRLGRARFEVLDLLSRAREGQTALIAYGAEPFVVAPLTSDAATIAAQVPHLETNLLPVQEARRTDLAVQAARELLQQAGASSGTIILVTDGIDDPAATIESVRAARSDAYRVSVLAVTFEDEAQFREIARVGGGRYVQSSFDDRDVEDLLAEQGQERIGAPVERDVRADVWRDEGYWLLIVLLPLAAGAFRRGWLSPLALVMLMGGAPRADALSWADLWARPDQQAAQKFASGQADEAAQQFERPDWRAAAAYHAGEYQAALRGLEQESGVEADYNRGNTLAKLGRLQDALGAYQRALDAAPGHADARHNYELVKRLLDQQQQSQQQQSSQEPQANEQQSGEKQDRDAQQRADNAAQEEGEEGGDHGEQDPSQGPRPQQDQTEGRADQQAADSSNEERQPSKAGDQAQDREESREPGAEDLLNRNRAGDQAEQRIAANEAELREQEASQAIEHKLRRVPDDPGGLLRQRFLLQHLRRRGEL
jgi:Ca-activated chloride channel family protein